MDIFGLKPNELAAVIFGIVGMVFGAASYKRARRSEAIATEGNERGKRAEERAAQNDDRARDLAFAQRKLDVQNLLTDGESALLLSKRRMLVLRDAALEAGASDVIPPTEEFAAQYQKALEGLQTVRAEVNSISPVGKSHEELVRMIESYVVLIKRQYDAKLIEAEDLSFIDQAERNIRLVSVQNEVKKQLKRRGEDSGDD